MATYTKYITIQGDRLDTIAYKAYGDATAFSKIQDANPNIPISDHFEAGIELLIHIEEVLVSTVNELLPPWKRLDPNLATKQADNANKLASIAQSGGASFDKSFD